MQEGQALFVCRAPFTPFGAARTAMAAAATETAVQVPGAPASEYIREEADLDMHTPRVLLNHPLMMTRDDYVGSGWSGWRMSDVFGWPTHSRRRDYQLKVLRNRYMSQGFWPRPLLSAKPRKSSVMPGGRLMLSSANSVSAPTKRSVMSDHPRFFERMGFRSLSERRQ
jgi:hypothetical protein